MSGGKDRRAHDVAITEHRGKEGKALWLQLVQMFVDVNFLGVAVIQVLVSLKFHKMPCLTTNLSKYCSVQHFAMAFMPLYSISITALARGEPPSKRTQFTQERATPSWPNKMVPGPRPSSVMSLIGVGSSLCSIAVPCCGILVAASWAARWAGVTTMGLYGVCQTEACN